MLNEINGLKTPSIGSPRLRPADAGTLPEDPFGSDEALDAFLKDWTQSDTSNLETLAQVARAPVPEPTMPAPEEAATWQIEHLVARNKSVFAKAADALGSRPAESQHAPSRLLMTDETSTFPSSAGNSSAIFSDANAWKLFDQNR